MEKYKIDIETIYRKMTDALPWVIQFTLLMIRDEGLSHDQTPTEVYDALLKTGLVWPYHEESAPLLLSELGKKIVDFCTC